MKNRLYREFQFDGLVGPSHNYGGLSFGNTASTRHGGMISNPREAFIQGLEKMEFISGLGIGQAFLPPQNRPQLSILRRLGFSGSDEEVLAAAAVSDEHLLRQVSSASSMWTANAATVVSSDESQDSKTHLVPANLSQMFHRAIEADTTTRVLTSIFSDRRHFNVHTPLPSGLHFSDEGAANHIRLCTSKCFFHLFAWGRSAFQTEMPKPRLFPARQTLEASQSLARLHQLPSKAVGFPRQNEAGIDAGAFHTDVLGVGNDQFLMLHELAFAEQQKWISDLKTHLGDELSIIVASEKELPVQNAVKSYPFNSQVLTLPDGSMVIVAPTDSEEDDYSRKFLQRVVDEKNPIKAVHFLDVRQSMQNGGGPACLRLRIRLSSDEVAGIAASVFYNETMHQKLLAWCEHHYRDRLSKEDLADPLFHRESMTALDELTRILKLGSVYDFQLVS